MLNRLRSFICFFTILLIASSAEAKRTVVDAPTVNVVIDISSQSMAVKVNGWPYGRWKVSTARPGYYTPRGTCKVQRTAKVCYSRKYDNSPMPRNYIIWSRKTVQDRRGS